MPYKDPSKQREWTRQRDKQLRESGMGRARDYHLTLEALNIMLEKGCAANGYGECQGGLEIDHDHTCCNKTSKSCGKCVRKALCRKHNLALGRIESNPSFTNWALQYILEHK